MPPLHQRLRPDLQKLVHFCLHWQLVRRHRPNNHRIHVVDVINEIVEMGLECYAKKYGIQLPEIPRNGGQ